MVKDIEARKDVRIGYVFLLLMTVVIGACGGKAVMPDKIMAEKTMEQPKMLEAGIYEVSTGERLEPETLFERLGQAKFVLVGEHHDDLWHHEVQRRVYVGLMAESGSVALGMEMFERGVQPHLDAYITDEIDETAMLEQTEWKKRWGMDADFYSAVWRYAQESAQPVVGINIERRLVKEVGQKGVAGLSPEDREQLPEMDLSNDAYRQQLRDIFAQHGMADDEQRLDQFFQAQVLWDEAMADSAYNFMKEHSQIKQMVVLVGSGHLLRGWGIPSRLERRLGGPGGGVVVTVIPVTIGNDNQAEMRELKYLQAEAIADYVWIGK